MIQDDMVSQDLSHTSSVKVLTELLGRLEAAEGADRELDAELAALGGHENAFDGSSLAEVLADPELREWAIAWGSIPPATDSLDAALALVERVLPGWGIALQRMNGWGAAICETPTADRYHADAPTPAIALLIALVRALISRYFAGSDREDAIPEPARLDPQAATPTLLSDGEGK